MLWFKSLLQIFILRVLAPASNGCTPLITRIKKLTAEKKEESPEMLVLTLLLWAQPNGRILLYSFASASVEAQLEGGHRNRAVTCLSWLPGTSLYSSGDCTIVEWDVSERRVKSKWKAGTDEIGCVVVSPDSKYVLSASRLINLWDASTHKLLKSFTGHASPVLSLSFIPNTTSSGDYYFLSIGKGDRYINVWSLNKKNSEKSALVAMVLESEPLGPISTFEELDSGNINLAATTISGALQIFSHQLNGRCPKPLKPVLTVQVATNCAKSKESVEPIPIVSALFILKEEVQIAYGTGTCLAFENTVLSFEEKIQVLARQEPHKMRLESSDLSQVKVPDTQKTQYLAQSAANAVVSGVKRTHGRRTEVPMEERLENLSLSVARTDDRTTTLPRADNLAQLMLQALTSKDKAMLQTVLCRREEDIIKNTVKRLPLQMIEPLLKELCTLLNGKTAIAQTGAKWLRILLNVHAAHLMAHPDLVELLSPVIGLVESRLSLLPILCRLGGRLELLASQLDGASVSDENPSPLDMQSCVLMYQDADTSDDDDVQDDAAALGSESDDHWEELSDSNSDEEEDVNGDDEDNDVEMSE